MKKIFFLLLLIPFFGISQTTGYLRYDTVRVQKIGGNSTLIVENATRNLTNSFLQNYSEGRTRFAYALDSVWIDGDSVRFRYGSTTIAVKAGSIDTTSLSLRIDQKTDTTAFTNGIQYNQDSVYLGGRMYLPTTIVIPHERIAGKTMSTILISNRGGDSTRGSNNHHIPLTTSTTFDAAIFAVQKKYKEAWGDTIILDGAYGLRYGGAGVFATWNEFDSTSTRFRYDNYPIRIGIGGVYALQDVFLPRDSVHWSVAPLSGQQGSVIQNDLNIGDTWGYNVKIVPYDDWFPVATQKNTIDLIRNLDNTRTKKMYGPITNYVGAWKAYQSTIQTSFVDRGNYWSHISDFTSFGDYFIDVAGAGVTKEKVLAVATVDSNFGFISRPKWRPFNTTKNGFGFVQFGWYDHNLFEGKTRFGSYVENGNIPGTDSLLATVDVVGTGKFTDTLSTLMTPDVSDSSDIVATTKWVKQQGYGTGAGLADGDYGDITVGGSGTTMTIDQQNSAFWAGKVTDATGTTGVMVFNAAPVFTSNITTPAVYGGGAANDDITILGTSHATKTTSYIFLQPTGGDVIIGSSTLPTSASYALNVARSDLSAVFVVDAPVSANTGRAFAIGATGESFTRTILYANGYIGIGPGSATRDVFIGRSAANTIKIGGAYDGSGTGHLQISGNIKVSEQAAPSTPSSGLAVIYPKTDGNWYGKNDAGTELKLSNPTLTKTLMLEGPGSAENINIFFTPVAITITNTRAVLVGSSSPSVTYNIAFGTDRSSLTNVYTADQTVTSTTTGTDASGVNDNTIPANSWVVLTTSAQSGTVTQLNTSITFTED